MPKPVNRACTSCQADVDAASRFCAKCGAFVPGGPSGSRLASILSVALGVPLAIVLRLILEATVAVCGIVGVCFVMTIGWWLHSIHPTASNRIFEVLTAIQTIIVLAAVAYWLIAGRPLLS